jgi:hypothetical protein
MAVPVRKWLRVMQVLAEPAARRLLVTLLPTLLTLSGWRRRAPATRLLPQLAPSKAALAALVRR